MTNHAIATHQEDVTSADGRPRRPRRRQISEVRLAVADQPPKVTEDEITYGSIFLEFKSLTVDDLPSPSRLAFEEMAQSSPAKLAAWMLSGAIPNGHLSHAAEILGRETEAVEHADGVATVLLMLLSDESPLVREGAVYGLRYHRSIEIREFLQRQGKEDPSPGVREAIEEVLED